MKCFDCNRKKGPFIELGKKRVFVFKRKRYLCEKCQIKYGMYLEALKVYQACPFDENRVCADLEDGCTHCVHHPYVSGPYCLDCGASNEVECEDLIKAGRCLENA